MAEQDEALPLILAKKPGRVTQLDNVIVAIRCLLKKEEHPKPSKEDIVNNLLDIKLYDFKTCRDKVTRALRKGIKLYDFKTCRDKVTRALRKGIKLYDFKTCRDKVTRALRKGINDKIIRETVGDPPQYFLYKHPPKEHQRGVGKARRPRASNTRRRR